ncbi:hypothetical protein [Arthrobacter sp. SD76]|uniref:hypothetical protein n=1 Tax=Arthrobacter sp. SD76 TaxID=3415007 RepID=UPI003C74C579
MGITGRDRKIPTWLVVVGAAIALFALCMVLQFGLGLSLLLPALLLVVAGVVALVRALRAGQRTTT